MAKRSRRERRLEPEKRPTITPSTTPSQEFDIQNIPARPAAVQVETAMPAARKVVSFAHDYYYVYVELRNIVIITVLMFVVMWALQFLI
jgi:hypothetical protein